MDPAPARWRILAVLLTVIFMSLIGVSIINVALPSIQRDLGASTSDVQWVLSGYALTFGVVLVAAGRAGDIMGRGGIFLIGVCVFTLSSVGAGLAPDAVGLNVARFMQGFGSGLLNPQGIGMIQQYFRSDERGLAFGYYGTAMGVSVAVGPVLGGLLIEFGGQELGWRLTFLVNVPIGIIAIILGLIWFPKPLISCGSRLLAREAVNSNYGLRLLDPVGSALLGLAVLAILFPFIEFRSSALVWLLFPLGIILIYCWIKWERRCARLGRSPMVDLKIFSIRSFTSGTIIMTLYFLGMTSVWVLVALYVQEGHGKTALESGFFGLPAALCAAFAAHWSGKRVTLYGSKIVIGGLLLGLVGLVLSIGVVLLQEQGHVALWWLLVSLSFVGLAQGAVVSPNQVLTLAEVPMNYAGSSGAIMQTGQRIGTSVGIAVITAATFASLSIWAWPIAIVVGFALIGVVLVLALAVSIKDFRRGRGSQSRTDP